MRRSGAARSWPTTSDPAGSAAMVIGSSTSVSFGTSTATVPSRAVRLPALTAIRHSPAKGNRTCAWYRPRFFSGFKRTFSVSGPVARRVARVGGATVTTARQGVPLIAVRGSETTCTLGAGAAPRAITKRRETALIMIGRSRPIYGGFASLCQVRSNGDPCSRLRGPARAGGLVGEELEDVKRVADVWPALGLGDEPPGLLYAVNREYAEPDRELADGDEVAVIPPVSGGDSFRLSDEPLSLDAAAAEVADDRAGAIATFVGTTRIDSRGRTVRYLEYEAYPGMAEEVMERIAQDLRSKYELCDVAIHHRVGRVGIGETSVVIAVSAPHRQDALAACKEAIDTLKETVPLWKKEVYEGGEEWIGQR